MRRTLVTLSLVLLCSLTPSRALAWGYDGHRLIMQRAIELLPPELKPFFTAQREEIVIRVVDPDVWRLAGWDDSANHFVDFGLSELGPYPFDGLPRDYNAALEKFGIGSLKNIGMLPWREAEQFGNLRRGFESLRRQAPYGTSDITVFTAFASHYIQDATQPLHATNNHDGQLSGQNGLHTRFETTLIERYASRLRLAPAPAKPIVNVRDETFTILLDSNRRVEQVLAADKAAVGTRDRYDDEYFEKFFTSTQAILEERLNAAITATASMIIGAWEQAGRPAVPLKDPRPVQKVRK